MKRSSATDQNKAGFHIPVLGTEAVAALEPKDNGIYIDATFGRGGYTQLLLQQANCRVIAFDQDPEAIAAGEDIAKDYKGRLALRHAPFSQLGEEPEQVDGVAFDLGVSSPQLDTAERGFSFRLDGPLDMRMSQSGDSAADLVNNASVDELTKIIRDYGDEPKARRIAQAIVAQRTSRPFLRTGDLASLVASVVPRQKDGHHPATKTFQALRIAVNNELGELQEGLRAAEKILKVGGRMAVVSFHSLEDRIVKNYFRDRSTVATTSRHMPIALDAAQPTLRVVTRQGITASEEDLATNPRARSARLRVAEKIAEPTGDAA
ncbi:MAG TPA: 16S rRNA (cytosine(1402)-N(4))-methyltransferase RsmH [Alphaproteobacteria bacterium]